MENNQIVLEKINEICLEAVKGSVMCEYTVLENKLVILYQNQEKILQAIKILAHGK